MLIILLIIARLPDFFFLIFVGTRGRRMYRDLRLILYIVIVGAIAKGS